VAYERVKPTYWNRNLLFLAVVTGLSFFGGNPHHLPPSSATARLELPPPPPSIYVVNTGTTYFE
jgi:hypothetical protein